MAVMALDPTGEGPGPLDQPPGTALNAVDITFDGPSLRSPPVASTTRVAAIICQP